MNVFITGITGSLGAAIAKWHGDRGDPVFGCARNEQRVIECRMASPRVAEILCEDAANLDRVLTRLAFQEVRIHRVYHCAALKHVDHAERSPEEALHQNLTVLQAVIEACHTHRCELIVPGSDKACLPQGVYGATKLLAERLVISAGFAVVRFGNLLGSSGSVFARWKAQRDAGQPIQLTDRNMTRFFISIHEAAEVMATRAIPARVVVPEMRSMLMGRAALLWPKVSVVGLRPGERLHEWAIAPGERLAQSDGLFILGDGEPGGGYSSDNAYSWVQEEFVSSLAELGLCPARTAPYPMCG